MTDRSVVVLFSGGLGSWAAARRLADAGRDLILVFTDTRTEDEDLYRWLTAASANIGAPLINLADGRDVWELFNDHRFIGNTRVDICSRVLKRELSRKWINENCDPETHEVALGIDWTEVHRYERAAPRWEPYKLIAPLCNPPFLDRADVERMAKDHGLRIPRLYKWSAHNNCGGFCVKAGHGQFAALLKNMPERYAYHEQKEQELREVIGKDVAIMRDRRGGTSTPLTLRSFRERIEAEETEDVDLDDFGGCGCMVDDD